MDWIVVAIGLLHAPVKPGGGGQLVVEVGRKRKRLLAKDLLFQQRDRLSLLPCLDNAKGRRRLGILAMAAGGVQAAHETRGHKHRLAVC